MSDKRSDDEAALRAYGIGIWIALAIGIAFFNAPGMIVLYFVSQYLSPLAVSQMWTFSIIISALVFGLITLRTRDAGAAVGILFVMGAMIIATLLIMKFGFLSSFPGDVMLRYGFT